MVAPSRTAAVFDLVVGERAKGLVGWEATDFADFPLTFFDGTFSALSPLVDNLREMSGPCCKAT